MSKPQLKEKDLGQNSSNKDLEADFLLNKHLFRTAAYSAAGFGVGLAASLVFFKHKAAMTALCAGAGAGYGIAGFASDWNKYSRQKNWAQAQKDRLQRDDDGQAKRNFDQFAFNQFSQNQRQQDKQKYDEKQERQRDESRLERQRDDRQKDDSRQERQRDENRLERQKDNQRQERQRDDNKQERSNYQRDERGAQEKSQTKSENQGQQQRQDLKQSQQSQQNKQQGQFKEKPLNPEAQQKQDIAEQRKDPHDANPEPTRMGKAPIVAKGTQDKAKRVEEAVHSQSAQGSQSFADEVQRGERGPQNPSIPPNQRDWKGGHAFQSVFPGQVHRGKPEDDVMGKPGSSPAPKVNQDKGPSKQENQALSSVNLKGQHLQTFQSNPNPVGKAGLTHEIKKDYQEGRNQANDPNLDNWKRQMHGLEQDRMGQSVKEGNNIKVRERSETAAGVGNYRPGVAEQLPKNQVNAVIE